MSKDLSKVMVDVTSDEHFQELIDSSEEKLVLIDCYSEWCGTCEALHPTLQKVWLDYDNASERIILASASMDKLSDSIQSIFPRENAAVNIQDNGCLPLFLILRFKSLVSHISGVDAPQLLSLISTNIPEKPQQDEQ